MLSQENRTVSKSILRKKSYKTSFWSFSFLIIPGSLPCTDILAREEEQDSIDKHDRVTGTALPAPANVEIKLILDLIARIPDRSHHMVSLKLLPLLKNLSCLDLIKLQVAFQLQSSQSDSNILQLWKAPAPKSQYSPVSFGSKWRRRISSLPKIRAERHLWAKVNCQ